MPRSHVIYAVFKRNFWSYFSGVTGYLFIIAFVTLGAYVAFSERFFTNNIASLDLLNEMFPWLLLFIVPAITMNIWSEERKLGTDELLFTLPVSDLEVLLGKFKAVVAVYTVALAFSLSHAIFLASIGQPDWGQLIAVYFGYWLAGAALLSAGMLASALTNSAPVAYVFGVLFAAVPVILGTQSFKASSTVADIWLIGGLVDFLGRALQWASVGWNLVPFGRGQIQLGNVLYFVAIAAFFLFLNYIVISRRRWNSGAAVHAAMPWHMLARGLCAGDGDRRQHLFRPADGFRTGRPHQRKTLYAHLDDLRHPQAGQRQTPRHDPGVRQPRCSPRIRWQTDRAARHAGPVPLAGRRSRDGPRDRRHPVQRRRR